MREEYIQTLTTKYPEMFLEDNKLRCEISIGDGWYELINSCCNIITEHIKWNRKYNKWDESITVKCIQIKEKFGGLRFYIYGGDEFCRGVINMTESMSYKTCESCGNIGSLREDGWMRTLCDSHEQERRWRQNDKSKTVLPDS